MMNYQAILCSCWLTTLKRFVLELGCQDQLKQKAYRFDPPTPESTLVRLKAKLQM